MLIEANGISMSYEIEGPADAPIVTMSHSLAANLAMWDDQMPALAGAYRVLRYDSRGHGATEAPEGGYTMELLADDLLALLDALAIDKTQFVGLSMGGMVGMTAALKDQGRFRSLALCDTASRMPPESRGVWDERIAAARTEGMEALLEQTIERWFSKRYIESRADKVDAVRAMIRSTPVAGFCGCCEAILRLDLTDRIAAIAVPTLIVVGADDPGTPVAAHEVIRDRIAGSELVVLPDALHFSNVEQEGPFNDALTGFLARHQGLA